MTKKFIIAFLAAALLTAGALAGSLMLRNVYAQDTTPTVEAPEAEETPVPVVTITTDEGDDDLPPFRYGGTFGISGDDALVAEKLGVTSEAIVAARATALEKALADAVAAGVITQTQADTIKANGVYGWGQLVRFAGENYAETLDHDKYFAEALGVTVEALNQARVEVRADQVTALVKAGRLTQEQADLMLAHQALGNNTAFRTAVRTDLEARLGQAVSDGTLTQAQADALLAQMQKNQNCFNSQLGFGKGMQGGMFGQMQNGFQGFMDGIKNHLHNMFELRQGGQPSGMMGGQGPMGNMPGGMMGGRGSMGGGAYGQGGMGYGNGLCDGICINQTP
ncbi:MAG: hypothetical protein GXY37_08920 [Chloroflexi bacterium]|nr:hypothetical protein [Chloroflexota bacterium]